MIQEYGSVHVVSTEHGERKHKVTVKPLFKRTSRKKRTAQNELFNVVDVSVQLEALIEQYKIRTPRQRKRLLLDDQHVQSVLLPSVDEFTLSGVRYELRSFNRHQIPETFPLLRRGNAFKFFQQRVVGLVPDNYHKNYHRKKKR